MRYKLKDKTCPAFITLTCKEKMLFKVILAYKGEITREMICRLRVGLFINHKTLEIETQYVWVTTVDDGVEKNDPLRLNPTAMLRSLVSWASGKEFCVDNVVYTLTQDEVSKILVTMFYMITGKDIFNYIEDDCFTFIKYADDLCS